MLIEFRSLLSVHFQKTICVKCFPAWNQHIIFSIRKRRSYNPSHHINLPLSMEVARLLGHRSKWWNFSSHVTWNWRIKTLFYPIENHLNNNNWLVVLTIFKNMKVNGKDDIPYIMENIIPYIMENKWKKYTFETTNQYIYISRINPVPILSASHLSASCQANMRWVVTKLRPTSGDAPLANGSAVDSQCQWMGWKEYQENS